MADDFTLKGNIIDVASGIIDPVSEKSLLDAHMLEGTEVEEGIVTITLHFPEDYPRDKRWDVEDALADAVEAVEGVKECRIKGFVEGDAPGGPAPKPAAPAQPSGPAAAAAAANSGPPKASALDGVGRVIAVASGKGGVGKSTVAVNLALALRNIGFKVGLLDIDIYGPSLPTLLGVNDRPNVKAKRIMPLEAHGLKLMSLGFLMEDDTPVIWRGPIVTGIIRQFLQDVDWEGTDYLIVDMPPGTGDAQLSLAQSVPVDGAVVVTTPSDLALIDAARGLRMFNTLNVDVLGIVENMSFLTWPGAEAVERALASLQESGADSAQLEVISAALDEHKRMHIFGKGGGKAEAKRLETEFLGEIPLDPTVREGGDKGQPIALSDPDGPIGKAFEALARKVSATKPLDEGGPRKKSVFSFMKS